MRFQKKNWKHLPYASNDNVYIFICWRCTNFPVFGPKSLETYLLTGLRDAGAAQQQQSRGGIEGNQRALAATPYLRAGSCLDRPFRSILFVVALTIGRIIIGLLRTDTDEGPI